MIEIQGKYNKADVFASEVEPETYKQILNMCNLEQLKDSVIKIMPDCHAGKGCTIGTTILMPEDTPINPFFVGVDIGCGVELVDLYSDDMYTGSINSNPLDFRELDKIIRTFIPYGFSVNGVEDEATAFEIKELNCYKQLQKLEHLHKSLGTLGGGNHFIEVSKDQDGRFYLQVHSGSRNLGNQVATIYGKIANKDGFLTGELKDKYLHDMRICQNFAKTNRNAICQKIAYKMGIEGMVICDTVHNYIETFPGHILLRKGAVRANHEETLVIPMNMRDGTIIARGLNNQDWNYSAPHGAGRILSRSQAKKKLDVKEFETQMKDIYSTCISKDTLDESPMAYKPMETILDQICDTVRIIDIITPVYNFKA